MRPQVGLQETLSYRAGVETSTGLLLPLPMAVSRFGTNTASMQTQSGTASRFTR